MERSVVSAVLVTMIVTRTVMRLWAIGGGGGGGQEAGAIETANSMWAEEGRSVRLFQMLKFVVNAENEWWRRDSRIRGRGRVGRGQGQAGTAGGCCGGLCSW